MNSRGNRFKRLFLIKWILCTIIAWAVGLFVSVIITHFVNVILHEEGNLVSGLCSGLTVGYAQWFVLKKQIKLSSWWGLGCAIGIGVPITVCATLDTIGLLPGLEGTTTQVIGLTTLAIFGGCLSGLLQMRLLKPHSPRAAWWILASSIGWGSCWFLVVLSIHVPQILLIGFIMSGILLGVITGPAILWILIQPIQEESAESY